MSKCVPRYLGYIPGMDRGINITCTLTLHVGQTFSKLRAERRARTSMDRTASSLLSPRFEVARRAPRSGVSGVAIPKIRTTVPWLSSLPN